MPEAEPAPGDGLARWSELHEGIDPGGRWLLVRWLRLVQALAAPMARFGVAPDTVTAAGALSGLSAPVLVLAPGGRVGLVLATAAVVLSALLDGLDGAVALLADRVSSYGRALDSAADRVSELAGFAALGLAAGVPWWALGLLAVVGLGMEGARIPAGWHGAVTVWERPTRTVLTAIGLAAAAVPLPFSGGFTAAVGLLLAAAGALQLLLALRSGVPSS